MSNCGYSLLILIYFSSNYLTVFAEFYGSHIHGDLSKITDLNLQNTSKNIKNFGINYCPHQIYCNCASKIIHCSNLQIDFVNFTNFYHFFEIETIEFDDCYQVLFLLYWLNNTGLTKSKSSTQQYFFLCRFLNSHYAKYIFS